MIALGARLDAGMLNLETKLDQIADRLASQRESMPELYVPRREINERFNNVAEDTTRVKHDLEGRIEEEVQALTERRQEIVAGIDKRLGKIEDAQTWLMRAVIGSILTGLTGLGFSLIRMGAGVP